MADLNKRPTAYTPEQLAAIREASTPQPRGVSSQAGLAATRGPARSVPSSPAPGQPGSRFNPVIRDRRVRPQASAGPDMVTSADVPGRGHGDDRKVSPIKLPAGQRLKESKAGRVVQSEGFRKGAKRVGTEVMRDAAAEAARVKQGGLAGKGVMASAVKGAATGMVRGLRTEMTHRDARAAQPGHDQETKDTSMGTDLVGRLGAVVGKAPEIPKGSPKRTRQPLSERYDYQFEGQDQSSGVEQQRD